MLCVNSIKNIPITPIKFSRKLSSVPFSRNFLLESDTFVHSVSPKSERITSNPLLEAVEKALAPEPKVKIADNMHKMIVDTTKSMSDAMGKDAIVFPIPDYKDLVLRVEKSAINKMDALSKNLELVPISYSPEVKNNKHLGLPLYYVTSSTSSMARKNKISPMEALAQSDKIMVLRRVKGQHPSYDCGEKLMSLIGVSNCEKIDYNALNNFSYVFGYVYPNFGYKSAAKCLDLFKSGESYIPANFFGEGSTAFEIVDGKNFFKNYKEYTSSYIKSLKDISEIPQKSYDDAVNFIASPKSFNVDFQHTNNTFVDLENKEFNFMDFAYDKKDEKYIYENPVKEFRNVLFGKGFRRIDVLKKIIKFMPSVKYPRDFVVYPEDVQDVKQFSKIINDKINLAAPDEFKSVKVFS